MPTAGTIYETAAVQADSFRLNTNLGLYTNFVNLLDLTAIAAPAGFRKNGLLFGISLIAPAFTERALLDLTMRLEGKYRCFFMASPPGGAVSVRAGIGDGRAGGRATSTRWS